jgi:hydroxyethylthiazole kinase-like uncharacterized protein yjeF
VTFRSAVFKTAAFDHSANPPAGPVLYGSVDPRQASQSPEELRIAPWNEARLPARSWDAHKGRAGHLLIVGGSVGLAGAPRLAARAAQIAGAGRVTLLVPSVLRAEAAADPDILVEPMPATLRGSLARPALPAILEHCGAAEALLLGPGLSSCPESLSLARALLDRLELPVVVDADALRPELLEGPCARPVVRVLTPHPGEAARLLGRGSAAVQGDRAGAVLELRRRFGGVVLLKGWRSLCAGPSGVVEIRAGGPGLARAGSGDLLAGCLGALLAQGLDAETATRTAAHLHGRASDRIASSQGVRAQTMGALLEALARTVRDHEEPPPVLPRDAAP